MTRKRFHHQSSHQQQNRFNNRNIMRSRSIGSSNSSSVTRSDEIPKEIPGYYYDHEKNRYFKIMPNKAVGSNNPFSADSIMKRAEEVKSQILLQSIIMK
jgi:WD repeat-containing protein 21A